MSAADNVHLKVINFFRGLKPEPSDFLNFIEPVKDALARIQKRFASEDARPMAIPAISLPGSFQVTVSAGLSGNAGVAIDGLSVDWEADLLFDATVSNGGNFLGSTAPAASKKRYVLLAVRHKVVGADTRTDKEGESVFYEQTSTTEKVVYQTGVDENLSDDYTVNTALISLLSLVSDDSSIPLAICELKGGAADFLAADVHPIQKVIYPAGGPAAEAENHRLFTGYGVLATVLTADGKITANAITVQGAPGRVDLPGGEEVLLTLTKLGANGEFREVRSIRTVLPASSENFLDESEKYVIRAKWDEGAQSLQVYQGKGDYPNDTFNTQPFQEGAVDGVNQGFKRTLVDLPLVQVDTGLNGETPVLQLITNQVLSEFIDIDGRLTAVEAATGLDSDIDLSAAVGAFTFPNSLHAFLVELNAAVMLNSPSFTGDLNTLTTVGTVDVGGALLVGASAELADTLDVVNKITSSSEIQANAGLISNLLSARTGSVISGGVAALDEFRGGNTCRAWAKVSQAGGTYTVDAAFGFLTGVGDPPILKVGTGNIDMTMISPMDDTDYVVVVSLLGVIIGFATSAVTSSTKFNIRIYDTTPALQDDGFTVAVFGSKG